MGVEWSDRDLIRLATRASVRMLLRMVGLYRVSRNLNDGLIGAYIVQANIDQITRDPVLQRRYATLDSPPPDELRRPVSVSAVANALRLPYETVRRRVNYLAGRGLCQITPKGVLAPSAVLSSPMYVALLSAHCQVVEDLYNDLRDIGFLPAPDPAVERFPPETPPFRAITRLSADYALRLMEYLTLRIGDVTDCVLFLEILNANTDGFTIEERRRTPGGDLAFLDDAMRKPIPVAALAAKLSIPAETARRHVLWLIDAGRCVRVTGGVIVPAAAFDTPQFGEVLRDNAAFANRLFAGLAPLGVLADWEERRATTRPIAGTSARGVARADTPAGKVNAAG